MATTRDGKPIRYYPSERWPEKADQIVPAHELKEESRLQWDALYDLKGNQPDVREFMLNSPRAMNILTQVGKPLLTILIQDMVGGWDVSWPLKFRGTSAFVFDKTPNTYTVIFWYPVSEDKVLLIAGSSGVPL